MAPVALPDRPVHLGVLRWCLATAAATAAVLAVTLAGPAPAPRAVTDPADPPAALAPPVRAPTVTTTPTPEAVAPDSPSITADPALVAEGRDVYLENCAVCHGTDATGASAPSLIGVARRYPDPAAQELVVRSGFGAMPGWGSRLTDAEIAAVVDYTRRLG